jgi:hypothetical protein
MQGLINGRLDNKFSNSFDALPVIDTVGTTLLRTMRRLPLLVALLMVVRGGLRHRKRASIIMSVLHG